MYASDASDTHFVLVGTSYLDLDLDPGEPELFAPGPSIFISRYAF